MQQFTDQTPITAQSPVSTVSLIDLLRIITKRSRMIFVVTLSAMVISIVGSLFLPKIYTAKTLILPSQEDKGLAPPMMGYLGGLAGITGGIVGGPSIAELYASMLKSEAVRDPIIDRFNLLEVYRNKYRMDTYKALDKNVVITSGKKDGIITITVNDKNPKRAADMANAYVEELGKLAVSLNASGAGKNRIFLEERLGRAKADLAKAEENLKAFQSKHKAVQVNVQADATIKGIAALRGELAAQEVRLATYRRQFTESSQEVKNLVTSIANIKRQILKLEGEGGYNSIPSVGSVPAISQESVRLMREFKTQESLVDLLVKQYELSKFSEAKDISPFQVIHKAKVPEKKSKPSRTRIVKFTVFVAFLCSVVFAFVLEKASMMSEEQRVRWREMRDDILFWKRV
jgi:uncharacterized protein involved in exopolysaccharide biosynthesis